MLSQEITATTVKLLEYQCITTYQHPNIVTALSP